MVKTINRRAEFPFEIRRFAMATMQVPEEKDLKLEEAIEKILDEKAKSFSIKAVARQGYVNLCGFVDNISLKREIGALAESVPGVRIVTNHLHVRSWEEKRNSAHL
jgi:osmotically-inducible protein OsmY